MRVEQVSVPQNTLSRYRKLGRDFAWILTGTVLLGLLL